MKKDKVIKVDFLQEGENKTENLVKFLRYFEMTQHIQSSIRSPDRLLPPHGKTHPIYVVGQCSDGVAVVPLLGRSIVEAARLERTAVAQWRRSRRRRRQVGAVGRGLGGVGERRQVVHSGRWSVGGC